MTNHYVVKVTPSGNTLSNIVRHISFFKLEVDNLDGLGIYNFISNKVIEDLKTTNSYATAENTEIDITLLKTE